MRFTQHLSPRRFLRVFLALGILSLGLGLVSQPGYAITLHDCTMSLSRLFGKAPESVPWTKRLDQTCSVTHQNGHNSCWAHSSAKVYTVVTREAGLIGKTDELSPDYYFARYLKKQVDEPYFGRYSELIESGQINKFDELVLEYGAVTTKQYVAPNVGVSGKTVLNSGRLREEFYKEISAGGDKQQVFKKYFGDLDLVPSVPIPSQFRADANSLRSFQVVSAQPSAVTTGLGNKQQLYNQIKKSIDAGYPVFAGWHNNKKVFEVNLKYFGNIFLKRSRKKFDSSPHAMTIVGYRTGQDGQVVDLLIQNSWGKNWGQNGLMVANQHFFEKYIDGIATVIP